jgi:hypothetical protein
VYCWANFEREDDLVEECFTTWTDRPCSEQNWVVVWGMASIVFRDDGVAVLVC